MIPISPMTVKFTEEERARLKAMAALLGWTESQIVRDSLAHSHQLIYQPSSAEEPRLVTMGRLALCHEENPELLQKHIKKAHSTHRSSPRGDG